MAWVYFSSALIKLRVAGLSYFSADNLPALAIMHSLDNLHDTQFRFAFWLPAIRQYLPVAVGLVLLWELLFPLAVFWKRVRWYFLGIGLVFHLSTLFLMNIFFPYQLAMYLVFVDWPRLTARLRIPNAGRASSCGATPFCAGRIPQPRLRDRRRKECFWDGDCGFAQRRCAVEADSPGDPSSKSPISRLRPAACGFRCGSTGPLGRQTEELPAVVLQDY